MQRMKGTEQPAQEKAAKRDTSHLTLTANEPQLNCKFSDFKKRGRPTDQY